MQQKNGFDRFPEFKSKGIEFDIGDKYLFRQLTGLLIHHQNPLRDDIMKSIYFLVQEEEVERLIKSKK
jgi:hypothetical protein